MHHYLTHLLSDITYVTENVSWPFVKQEEVDIHDWVSPEEEERSAPVRNLEEWTGIRKEQLPPHEMLSEEQVHELLNALKKMLNAYNWSFVLQTEAPERIQYAALRDNFDQQVKVKQWHYGFFEVCKAGTEHGKCSLGEYCQCAFYAALFSGFSDETLSHEEERARVLEMEIQHLKKKYGSDWLKYYPYHLDANYDDENGNSHDYGFGHDEDDKDNWWKR